MSTSQANRATASLNRAKSDFWEGGYLVGEYHIRRTAKRDAKRAARRLSKTLTKESASAAV